MRLSFSPSTMWKKQLRAPLSTFLRKTLPRTASPVLTEKVLQAQNFTNFSSPIDFNANEQTRVSRIIGIHPPWSSEFLGKSFCSSGSAEKMGWCWKCKSERPFLVCQSCGSIQPVDNSVDYFQIFGLERKFDIKDENLEGKYKDWQKKLHPDLVHTKSKEEREYAAEQSARVIDAYSTLRDTLSRAIYIMRIHGVEVDEEQTLSEPELLGEIMEIREAVEEAADSQALYQIQSQMQEKMSHWSDYFANAFQSQKYDEALKSIQRMTYYHRVKEEIVKKL